MKDVWSWANHIQAIHSQCPILRSTKLLGQPKKKPFDKWNCSRWKINVCKMKGLIVHPIVWEHLCGILKILIKFPKFPLKFLQILNFISFQSWSSKGTWSWWPLSSLSLSLSRSLAHSWRTGIVSFLQFPGQQQEHEKARVGGPGHQVSPLLFLPEWILVSLRLARYKLHLFNCPHCTVTSKRFII